MKRKGLIGLFLCAFVVATTTGAMAATLQVGDKSAAPGATVQIPVYAISSVDDATGVAGAAFTLQFDETVLTNANITSEFFGTFQSQLTAVNPNYTGPFEADGYDKPLVDNALSGTGISLAAANVQAQAIEAGEGTVIFYLNGTVGADVAVGDYEIRVASTELNNTNAGYDANGEAIDLLIGADANIADPADPAAFPVLLSAAEHNAAGSVGTLSIISFIPGNVDKDPEGKVNATDALYVLNYVAGNIGDDLVDANAADAYQDGTINATDALMILNFTVGNIDSLPFIP